MVNHTALRFLACFVARSSCLPPPFAVFEGHSRFPSFLLLASVPRASVSLCDDCTSCRQPEFSFGPSGCAHTAAVWDVFKEAGSCPSTRFVIQDLCAIPPALGTLLSVFLELWQPRVSCAVYMCLVCGRVQLASSGEACSTRHRALESSAHKSIKVNHFRFSRKWC